MSEKLKQAEAALKELEKHRHARQNAHAHAIKMARRHEEDKTPESASLAAEAARQHEALVVAEKQANVDPRAVDIAAQAVLDARAEAEGAA